MIGTETLVCGEAHESVTRSWSRTAWTTWLRLALSGSSFRYFIVSRLQPSAQGEYKRGYTGKCFNRKVGGVKVTRRDLEGRCYTAYLSKEEYLHWKLVACDTWGCGQPWQPPACCRKYKIMNVILIVCCSDAELSALGSLVPLLCSVICSWQPCAVFMLRCLLLAARCHSYAVICSWQPSSIQMLNCLLLSELYYSNAELSARNQLYPWYPCIPSS